MGVSALRVINEDRVQPGKGFPPHSHRDMEILTYVFAGALAHKDSLGNGSVIYPGDVQRMSAGTGITHSECNPSSTDLLHLLQIWLLPNRTGLSPSYEQRTFPEVATRGQLRLVASSQQCVRTISLEIPCKFNRPTRRGLAPSIYPHSIRTLTIPSLGVQQFISGQRQGTSGMLIAFLLRGQNMHKRESAAHERPIVIEGKLHVRARLLRVEATHTTEVAAGQCSTDRTAG